MLRIPPEIIEEIIIHGKRDAPIEACGYIAGIDGTAKETIAMTNIDNSAEHYTFDPEEQFAAVKTARAKDLELIAVYHTHPETPARMSDEDIRLANDPEMIFIIYSLFEDRIKGFKVTKEKSVTEIEVELQ